MRERVCVSQCLCQCVRTLPCQLLVSIFGPIINFEFDLYNTHCNFFLIALVSIELMTYTHNKNDNVCVRTHIHIHRQTDRQIDISTTLIHTQTHTQAHTHTNVSHQSGGIPALETRASKSRPRR